MRNAEFVDRVRQIADSNPTYRTGGSGKDGTCDCIGLIMGALGKKYDLHSSNYFARYQMRMLDNLLDESQLHIGSIVYKSRRDTSNLNARYQAGGRYYNGDILDYYHVGVVTEIAPLEITHCTSSGNINGIAYDTSIKPWSHFGDLLDVTFDDTEDDIGMLYTVTTPNGKPVNLRMRPDKNSPKVGEIPVGEDVNVVEQASGWSKVQWNGLNGYVMSEFLLGEDDLPFSDAVVTFEDEVLAKLDEILALLTGGGS